MTSPDMDPATTVAPLIPDETARPELVAEVTGAPLAVFDLDRTLHAGSGLGVLARHAFRHRLIGPERMARSFVHDLVFRRRGSTDDHTNTIAELALDMAGGVTLDELVPVVEATAQQIAATVRPSVLDLLRRHQAAGHYCVVLSASPQLLVERIGELLGVPCSVGTRIEDDNGTLTGRIIPPMAYGHGKLDRLQSVIGWPDAGAEPTTTYAYADSMSDLPLLEAVDAPIVVAPERKLRTLAYERGWPVIDF
ncbi:MAG: HAD family hydrolase [Acidimicrobiales bacterium]